MTAINAKTAMRCLRLKDSGGAEDGFSDRESIRSGHPGGPDSHKYGNHRCLLQTRPAFFSQQRCDTISKLNRQFAVCSVEQVFGGMQQSGILLVTVHCFVKFCQSAVNIARVSSATGELVFQQNTPP